MSALARFGFLSKSFGSLVFLRSGFDSFDKNELRSVQVEQLCQPSPRRMAQIRSGGGFDNL